MDLYLLLVFLVAFAGLCLSGPGAAFYLLSWLILFPLWLAGQIILLPGRAVFWLLSFSWSFSRRA